jgi:hypothetical protein
MTEAPSQEGASATSGDEERSLDLDNLLKASGQVETALGIAAQTRIAPAPSRNGAASPT